MWRTESTSSDFFLKKKKKKNMIFFLIAFICESQILIAGLFCAFAVPAGSIKRRFPPLPRFQKKKKAIQNRLLAKKKNAAKNPKGARLEPADLREQLALEEAKAGAGSKMLRKLGDAKYDPVTGTHDKYEYNHKHGDGTSTEIHYDVERATGARSGFKIKDDTNKASRGHTYLQLEKT